MLKVVVTAAALSLIVCAAASAFPVPKPQTSPPDLIEVGKKHHDKHYKAYKGVRLFLLTSRHG